MVEIFLVQVDCVSLILQINESCYANSLVFIELWICDQLDETHIYDVFIWSALRIVAADWCNLSKHKPTRKEKAYKSGDDWMFHGFCPE